MGQSNEPKEVVCRMCGRRASVSYPVHGPWACTPCLRARHRELHQLDEDERSEHDYAPGGPGTA